MNNLAQDAFAKISNKLYRFSEQPFHLKSAGANVFAAQTARSQGFAGMASDDPANMTKTKHQPAN